MPSHSGRAKGPGVVVVEASVVVVDDIEVVVGTVGVTAWEVTVTGGGSTVAGPHAASSATASTGIRLRMGRPYRRRVAVHYLPVACKT